MVAKEKVSIVVPIYREKLDHTEVISLRQLVQVMDNYHITVVHPKKVNPAFLKELGLNFDSLSFDNEYFDGIYGYNRLTLSTDFYGALKQHEYILIYQTDAYIFRDELTQWVDKGYDYIGGPWVVRKQTAFQRCLYKFNNFVRKMRNKTQKDPSAHFKVGNGGFSLRRTQRFLELSNKYKEHIERKVIKGPDNFIPEDVFWSLKIPDKADALRVPDYKEALNFCFDRRPAIAYKLNNKQLPFGAHGINKKKCIDFYQKFIKDL